MKTHIPAKPSDFEYPARRYAGHAEGETIGQWIFIELVHVPGQSADLRLKCTRCGYYTRKPAHSHGPIETLACIGCEDRQAKAEIALLEAMYAGEPDPTCACCGKALELNAVASTCSLRCRRRHRLRKNAAHMAKVRAEKRKAEAQ
jgi:predicted nucleic acid-binding Zn ribbon protein